MMKYFKKLKIDFFLIFLILFSLFVCYKNYTPKTFLSGWDTLHPEFNLDLYWQRIISVWQNHQGLGAPPSQSHIGELPRIIFLFFSSLIFPINFVRYSYFFLMIILGPVGVYLFLKYILKNNKDELIIKISSFLGALFYLLNLGTMQHFIVPLEMFATKFGLLGFLYLFATKFLNEGKKKNLIFFSLITIFASSMSHTATLWYVYFIGLILFLISYSSLTKNKNHFKKSLLLIAITLFLNLFWIFPNLYYAVNYNYEVINSKIHRLGTEEFYYHNKKYGQISDFLIFKNFLFDWYVTTNNGKIQPLLGSWNNHLNNSSVLIIGYFLSFVSLIGVFFAFRKKNLVLLSLLPILVLSSSFLLSDTTGISTILDWIRKTTPLIKEVFRFPFTKFSIYVIFCFSLFFGYFNKIFLNKITKNKTKETGNFFTGLYLNFFVFLILIYNLPTFAGNFISEIVRVKIPEEYFALFNWSKKQNHRRILLLPIYNSYGWSIYQWKKQSFSQIYQGAGFTWFGLKQPTLNSEFNRWYPYNEQSFREFFYAVYSKNSVLFEKLLQKYNIGYILLDENVIIPGDEEQSRKLFYPEIKKLLAEIENIKLVQQFGEKISLFEYLPNQNKLEIEILTDYKIVQPSYRWNYVDQAYSDLGNYITFPSKKSLTDRSININSFFYPARNILTPEEKINQQILSINKDSYQINLPINFFKKNGEIKIPSVEKKEAEFYGEVYAKKNENEIILEIRYLLPYILNDNNEGYIKKYIIENKNQKFFAINNKIFFIPENFSENFFYLGEVTLFSQRENFLTLYKNEKLRDLSLDFSSLNLSPYLCSQPSKNQIFGAGKDNSGFKIYGQAAKICLDIPLNEIIKIDKDGVLEMMFDYQNETDGDNEICLFDKEKNQCIITKNLQSFNSTANFLIPIEYQKSYSYFLKFSFDTKKETQIKELLIKNINFSFYEKTEEKLFIPKIISFDLSLKEIKIKGRFPQKKIEISPEIIDKQKNDCSFEKARFIDKKFIETYDGVVIEYQAINGSICDSIPLFNASQNTGYILAIESENVSGLPLKISFENKENKISYLEERLSKNKALSFDYFFIPPYFQKEGYQLSINNYSIGNLPAINRIKTIRLIPFPYNFFQSIRWEEKNYESKNNNKQIVFNQKQITNKIYSFLYQIEIKDLLENSLLALDQAFEKNWKAYEIECQNLNFICQIYKIFPFLFGKELKNHVIVNNWANGWIIADENFPESQKTIIIVFLPQYLQFLGFGILIFSFIFILRFKN